MSQDKVQSPYMPGLKEPVDLMDEQGGDKSGGAGRFISLGNPGDVGGAGREKQQGDYYSPVATEVVKKGGDEGKPSKDLDGSREGAEMNDLYSPEAGVDIVTSDKQSPPQKKTKEMAGAGTDEHEQRGEESGTVVSGPGLVEAGKGMATEVSDSLVSVRGRMMEKLSGLQLPSESLEAVRRTFETGLKGAYTTTRDAVQRTKQSLLDLFPSSHTSSSATEARKVVEEMEKDMLGNSEGSGEDMSQISEGPKVSISETSAPQFMRAKL
ncbi:hypothetical protein M758_6G117400 [Ceratodon purpureus]|nr:hypothetical protein M758_6G117400 [Ceratodon purpureus]